jgi:hypothetical protein
LRRRMWSMTIRSKPSANTFAGTAPCRPGPCKGLPE